MRIVIQRVSSASVKIDLRTGSIGPGILVLLGIKDTDSEAEADFLAQKCAELRIFEDEDGKMNRSLLDTAGSALVVSQFTLYGDCRKGRRPSFIAAAPSQKAERLYEYFVSRLREQIATVETGEFGAMMQVCLVNEGPVTLILEK
ncbi:MAG: D-tyrosyl-tRNA(Tyr) deacylase [Chitinivibrionales bacterium]|nr:D-tyrosyl-tRNA(Tyr) deacylase [Chitinivibrionales bacterium]